MNNKIPQPKKEKLRQYYLDNLEGKKFHKLLVLNKYKRKNNRTYWLCKCECGTIKFIDRSGLTSGNVKSCGCIKNKSLYMSKTSEYRAWQNIKYRCYNESYQHYKRYGGRGIKVCERWKNSFENFYKDMGTKPSPEHSIDRKDNNGDYCPENCKWATKHEQLTNKVNSSKYIGVRKYKTKYQSRITKDQITIHLGTFDTELEAAKVYDDKCEELYGYRCNKTPK